VFLSSRILRSSSFLSSTFPLRSLERASAPIVEEPGAAAYVVVGSSVVVAVAVVVVAVVVAVGVGSGSAFLGAVCFPNPFFLAMESDVKDCFAMYACGAKA